MSKATKVFSLGFLGSVLAGTLFIVYIGYTFVNSPSQSEDRSVIYEIPPGHSFAVVAKDLQELGVVKNAKVFSIFARLMGQRGKIKVGEYGLNIHMKPSEVLEVITSGKSIARPFTISEGLNIYEIAELFEKNGFGKKEDFIKAAMDPQLVKELLGEKYTSLEGYLYPETYQMTKYSDVQELIRSMVRRYKLVTSEMEALREGAGLSPRQWIILASLIEKESGSPGDRLLVASVFHNRLTKKMKLQTDPTILYGKTLLTGALQNNITREDLRNEKNFYNTYVISGLPPGPISNPGKESLLAALKPAKSNFLYFVSRNDGTTLFSESLDDHNKAVQKFQMDPKAREGKSWRDVGKGN